MNKNIPRLGGMATILAMAGATAVVRNSEADPSQMRGPHRHPADLTSPGTVQDSVRDGLNPYMPMPPSLNGDVRGLVKLSYDVGIMRGQSACPDPNPELGRELANLVLDNIKLRNELDATRAQVADLIERLETAHEEEVDGNGCPTTCTSSSAANNEFMYCNGASCLF